jgi:hypothetical protein
MGWAVRYADRGQLGAASPVGVSRDPGLGPAVLLVLRVLQSKFIILGTAISGVRFVTNLRISAPRLRDVFEL